MLGVSQLDNTCDYSYFKVITFVKRSAYVESNDCTDTPGRYKTGVGRPAQSQRREVDYSLCEEKKNHAFRSTMAGSCKYLNTAQILAPP